MTKTISLKKLERYFSVTGEALKMIETNGIDASTRVRKAQAEDVLDMAKRYFSDAEHFRKKGDFVNAFACLNYAHGWLDAGARLKLFNVKDSRLFSVDDE